MDSNHSEVELYNEVILELQKDDSRYFRNPDAEYAIEAYNRLCGDKFRVFVDYSDNLQNITFHGYGCALARASTALLVEHLDAMTWSEAGDSCSRVLEFFEDSEVPLPFDDQRFRAFEPVKNYPARHKCVALSWQSMMAFCYRQLTGGQNT